MQIHLQRREGRLFVRIADDGVGIFPGSRKKANAFGLVGIEERILALGGTFHLASLAGQGTTILLSILIGMVPDFGIGPDERVGRRAGGTGVVPGKAIPLRRLPASPRATLQSLRIRISAARRA